MTTNREVAKIMGVMVHAYPRYELSGDSIKLYGQLLADIPVDVLEASAQQIMVESKFFPSIAEWRDKARDLMAGAHNLPTAGEAWGEALEHCRAGHYTGYSHTLIQKAVEIIGIPYWRRMEYCDEMATRAHFFKIYEQLLSRVQDDMKLLPEARAVSAKYALGVGELVNKLGDGDCVRAREEVEV